MSYQLGTASRPRFSRVRPPFARTLVRPPTPGRKVRRRRGPSLPGMFQQSSNYRVGPMALSGHTRYLGDLDNQQLGFSLKPPKFVRKAAKFVKKNVTLKRALIGGAVVGAMFIPGVGPAALAASKAALFGAGRLVRGGGKIVMAAERGIVGLFKPKVPYGPQLTPEDAKALADSQAAAAAQAAAALRDAYNAANSGGSPSGGGGGAPSGGGGGYTPPAPNAGGGGGGDTGGDFSTAPLPDDSTELTASTAPTDTSETPSSASAMPLLLGIGTVALFAMSSRGRRRRRAA